MESFKLGAYGSTYSIIWTRKSKDPTLQIIANQIPDAFNATSKIFKSYIDVANIPTRVTVPERQSKKTIANENHIAHQKRGKPPSLKDKVPQKRKLI